MSVRKRTIEENGKRTISLQGSQTLTEALQALQDLQYSEHEAYLVVTLADAKYHVVLFADLKAILQKLGPDGLTQPLSMLPFAPASRIVPTDTEESGGDLLDWVASHPQAPVVVTDAGKFAALFINPNRSGDENLAGGLSLLGLQGPACAFEQKVTVSLETSAV